uniref:Uncharacterized protein n=1 Tax=Setaria digitata TaxID=48799 RepID=A0A915Q2U2_9BILA
MLRNRREYSADSSCKLLSTAIYFLTELPEQLRKELKAPQSGQYTIVREVEDIKIVRGICKRQFGPVKGWRIHASKLHKQDGFCTRYGHHLLTPPEYTAAQKAAIHVLDWCQRRP